MESEGQQTTIAKIMFNLRSNLFVQFSVVSFGLMLILAIILSVVVTSQFNRNIELLKLHNLTMMRSLGMTDEEMDTTEAGTGENGSNQIEETGTDAELVNVTIEDIQANVRYLQMLVVGLVVVGFLILYAGLFELVRRNWLTVIQQRKEITESRDKALEATQAKSTFLANMSHELRTPLNAIIGYSEMLEEDAEDAGYEDMVPDLGKIRTAGHHLLALINDILDISKIEAGKMELYLEKFSLFDLIDEITTTIQPLVDKEKNSLHVDKSSASRELMFADMTKVRQIIFNLLSNASKLTKNGHITITINQESKKNRDWVEIRISDTGIGMNETQLAKVFTEFQQADESTTRKFGGTGLGLTISRSFANMMGGDLSVASELGSGSTFTLSLPYTVTDKKYKTQETAILTKEVHEAVAKVLVIDDDPVVHDLLTRILSREGFHVQSASTGKQGIELALQMRPDVITLDLLMPEIDGWMVLSQLKEHPDLQQIPVIIISMLDEKNKGFTLGASDFMTKPVNRSKLLDMVQKFTGKKSDSISGTILLVEDNEEIRHMMKSTLERVGWDILQAENGRIGLEVMEKQIPELILLDLMMPEVDGFTFLSELRSKDKWRDVPVIILTAKDLSLDERRQLNTSAATIFQKTAFEQDELLQQIKGLVKERIEETNP
jgi:signal transduction histidine kinase/DNA-binding response OmpR family regulator